MRLAIIPLVVFLSICWPVEPVTAQEDSSRLDLGYFTLNKAFSQQITIRGTDLEMMPFTNLSDAIRVWLYDAYSVPVTLQYVVDGNPVVDVNAYSIHDIDEVTLVQNAAATMTTAPGQSELVLIKTKRGRGARGLRVAAQTGLVGANNGAFSSTTALFHNYYAGAYRNLKKISFGVSGNFIRDAFPYSSPDEKISTVNTLARWRLNGYFEWRPNDHHQIELTMNYTPQKWNGAQDTTGIPDYAALEMGHQHFLLPHLDWRASWGNGWTNRASGTYVRSTSEDIYGFGLDTGRNFQVQLDITSGKTHQWWFLDRIGYEGRLGNWTIGPSLNVTYQQFQNEVYIVQGTGPYFGSIVPNLAAYSTTIIAGYAEAKAAVWLLTPTLSFRYKQALDIEGGAIIHPGAAVSLTGNGREVYPFISAAVDLLRLSQNDNGSSLKLFGSVANRTQPAVNEYGLSDYSNGQELSFYLQNVNLAAEPIGLASPLSPLRGPELWTWGAGIGYSSWNGRLQIGYALEHRISVALALGPYSVSTSPDGYGKITSVLHHLDIRLKVLDGPAVSWRTGLNVTALSNSMDYPSYVGTVYFPVGDESTYPYSWTGGWVNRLQVKNFSAGLDLLYHFNDASFAGRKNYVTTPNVYAGYRFHLRDDATVQVFAETRGLFVPSANSYSDLTDARQYYTVGANLCL